jgi:anti-sigma B factor antagonist
MKFKDKIQGDVGILTLKGKLMGYPETDQLHDEIRSFIGQGIKKILVDLNDVNWMNSMGVGALMRCLTTVKNKEGDLRLSRLTDKIHSLFVMTQLIRVFNIYETIDKGIASYQSE